MALRIWIVISRNFVDNAHPKDSESDGYDKIPTSQACTNVNECRRFPYPCGVFGTGFSIT